MKKKKWPAKKKARFFLNLSRLLTRGYPLHHGAQLMSYRDSEAARDTINEWLRSLEDGKPWGVALEHLNVPSDISAYLYFSERYGMVANGFYYAGRMLKQREHFKEQVRQISRYPILLIWIVLVLFGIMTLFVFPQFEALFSTMNVDYPAITTLTFALFQSIPYLVGVVVGLGLLGYLYYQVSFKAKTATEKLRLLASIPLLQKVLRMYMTYTFSLQFGQLLKGGLNAHDVLQVFNHQKKMQFFSEEGVRLQRELNSGVPLDEAIRSGDCYTEELPEIIRHGQDAGQLADDLGHYSEMLWEELNEKAKRMTMIIQPILFLVIGFFMLMLFLSIFIPIFQLITSLDT